MSLGNQAFARLIEPRRGFIDLVRNNLAICGVAGFSIWFVGPANILPTNRKWVLFGDLRLAELHWDFYRSTALFQFPIAGTPNYVRVEPHPILFHFPFKLLNQVLPASFQFIGISIVAFFVLSAVIAKRLLLSLGLSKVQMNLGTLLLTVTPVLTFRVGILSHTMLGGHFLLLLAIHHYVRESSRPTSWITVVLLASFLDIYLLIVILTICFAHSAQQILKRRQRLFRQLRLQFVVAVAWCLSLFLQGYFSSPSSLVARYSFRLNLASFVNPHFAPGSSYSTLLPLTSGFFDRTLSSEEVEGFAYLGLGAILLVGIGMCRLIRTLTWCDVRKWAPLIVVSGFWLYVAYSPNAVVYRREFRLPEIWGVDRIREIFRGAPRFALLTYYLLLLLGIVQVSRLKARRSVVVGLLMALVLLQGLDISRGVFAAHTSISSEKQEGKRLNSSEWTALGQYRHLKIYPIYDFHSDFNSGLANYWIDEDRWYPLVSFAARNRLSSNFGYLSRENLEYTRTETRETLAELDSGMLDSCSIYAIPGEALWRRFSENLTRGETALQIDGYFLIVAARSSCG